MKSKIFTSSNKHLSFEINEALPEFVPKLGELVQREFGCNQIGSIAIGLSEVATELEISGIKLGIGWDIWSGAYIMAFCGDGDDLIRKIAEYLGSELLKPEYEEFMDKSLN